MNGSSNWKQAVRKHLSDLIQQTEGLPNYEAMAFCGLFLDELEQPLQSWVDRTDGSEASVAELEALLREGRSAMEQDLLLRKGMTEAALERFGSTMVQSISEALYQEGMAAA